MSIFLYKINCAITWFGGYVTYYMYYKFPYLDHIEIWFRDNTLSYLNAIFGAFRYDWSGLRNQRPTVMDTNFNHKSLPNTYTYIYIYQTSHKSQSSFFSNIKNRRAILFPRIISRLILINQIWPYILHFCSKRPTKSQAILRNATSIYQPFRVQRRLIIFIFLLLI